MIPLRAPAVSLLALTLTAGAALGQGVPPVPAPPQSVLIPPTGAPTGLTLSALAAQQGVLLDAFKVSGDADDSASLTRAVAAGVPILLGPKTYTINNFSSGAVASFVLRGVPGASIIQRTSASGSNFVTIGATIVVIDGVIFDSNVASVTANQWGVLLNQGGQNVSVTRSVFKNNGGTLGSCFALVSTGPGAGGSFNVSDNEITNCANSPVLLGSVSQGIFKGNYVHDNAVNGITVNSFGTPSGTNYASDIILANNRVLRNTNGINVGGFAPPYSFANPAAVRIQVLGNKIQDNSGIGLTLHGDYHTASGNQIDQSAPGVAIVEGIVCNTRYSSITGNIVNLAGAGWGIDCGGSVDTSVQHNNVTMTTGTAMDSGGNQNGIYAYNTLTVSGTSHAIQNYAVESDGNGNPFPTIASGTRLENNTIEISGSAQGIGVYDNAGGFTNAQPIVIKENNCITAAGVTPSQCLVWWGVSTSANISGNTLNGTNVVFADPNVNTDINFDNIFIGGSVTSFSSTSNARSIQTTAMNTYGGGGSIQYVYPSAGGSGYTAATTLAASGTGLSGWTGSPQILNGAIIGVRTAAFGSGGSGTLTVTATDSGGGTGATFVVGNKPSLPAYAELTYMSNKVRALFMAGGRMQIGGNATLMLDATTVLHLKAVLGGGFWQYDGYSLPTIALGSLPACNAGLVGAQTNVTGAGSQWLSRCDGTNWIPINGALPSLTGTTGSIGGGALLAGACASGTVAIAGSTTGQNAQASPVTYPGDGFDWSAYVSAPGTVTVKVCGFIAGTPVASNYNVRVIQ